QDHPEAGPILNRLRPGIGYRDLAGDLMGYGQLQETYASLLAGDTKYYRATDAKEAAEVASRMLDILGEQMTAQMRAARDIIARSWTLLQSTYDEVVAAGLFLERQDPRCASYYPSLVTASRRNRYA
ncbi:MAG: hypothetical protein R6X03_00960, partial [Methyloceanibacter sp.]